MWDKTEIRKVENGYVTRSGRYTLDREHIFRTFDELVEWLEEYFEDALGDKDE